MPGEACPAPILNHKQIVMAHGSGGKLTQDLIEKLTRDLNQARQAQITQEISEIVGGASALADANAGSE